MYGEKLRSLREKRGLTLEQIGKKLNVRHSTVGSWEKASYPPLKSIEKVCDLYNITLSEFFNDSLDEKNNIDPEERMILGLIKQKLSNDDRIAFWKLIKDFLFFKIGQSK